MSSGQVTEERQTNGVSGDVRLARILLPASILRDVDEIVLAGRGGYRTRQEFFSDAIQNLVLEVRYGVGDDGQLALSSDLTPAETETNDGRAASVTVSGSAPADASVEAVADSFAEPTLVEPITELAQTALPLVARGATITSGIAKVKQQPMFGLHNRDYPSIWAAVRLAQHTQHRLASPQEFLEKVTLEAWEFAASLLPLEQQVKTKLTALFPTNRVKPQSAEASFRSFAVGESARRPNDDGTVNATEGLFNWGAVQLVREDGRLLLGLTEAGYTLLDSMQGLTLSWPHEREFADAFIDYLKANAPWDWAGFATLLDVTAERPDRAALTANFNHWRPEWSATVANTNAAGYVARAREWGLLEPKLAEGRYILTALGDEIRNEA